MKLTPHIHLSFNGTCEAAFAFYATHLNGQVESSFRYGGSPAAATAPPGWDDKIMHATLRIGDSPFMLNDEFPAMGGKGPQALGGSPVTMHLYVADVDALFARAVAAGAMVTMPLADQFWGSRYGQLEDPFGHRWSLATHIEDVTPEESARRMKQLFGGG